MPIKMMQFVVRGSVLLMLFFRVDRNLFQKKGGGLSVQKNQFGLRKSHRIWMSQLIYRQVFVTLSRNYKN